MGAQAINALVSDVFQSGLLFYERVFNQVLVHATDLYRIVGFLAVVIKRRLKDSAANDAGRSGLLNGQNTPRMKSRGFVGFCRLSVDIRGGLWGLQGLV